ncbi:MAG: ankyrin repeat domain-containing protein [Puniceicoccales bacterium]|nr:ankyrin repeat domain-containing protein [Puniceicoccales bacterium]
MASDDSLERDLSKAALLGHVNEVNFLLKADVDPNCRCTNNSLTLAMQMVWLRLQLDSFFNTLGLTLAIFELLIHSPKFDPNLYNKNGETILHLAIKLRDEKITEMLLELPRINVNVSDFWKNTPFHLLAAMTLSKPINWSIVNKLIQQASVNTLRAQNSRGKTAIDILEIINDSIDETSPKAEAMKNDIYTLINIIKEAIIEKSIPSLEEQLRDAIIEENLNEIEFQMRNPNLNINWQDHEGGHTLLMFAITTGNLEILTLILQHPDIDFNLTDNAGKNAIDYAMDNCNEYASEYIREAMAQHLSCS